MSNSNQAPNVSQLFKSAHQDGSISNKTLQVLNGIVDVGFEIQAGLGIPVLDVKASEAVLLGIEPDDSGSIRMKRGNSQLVRDGHNMIIDATNATKQKEGILVLTRYLNGKVLNPYCPIDRAKRMDSSNYNPDLGTPLYDNTVIFLGIVIAKEQEFADNGVPVRTISVIISDGADLHSTKQKPEDVASVVSDMLKKENHLIFALGIDDTPDQCPRCHYDLKQYIETNGLPPDENCPSCSQKVRTDFVKVFTEMGIPDGFILTTINDESAIRKAFQLISQTTSRASQGAASYSQTRLGGFGGQTP